MKMTGWNWLCVIAVSLLLLFLVYWSIAATVYRFRHPHMTEIEQFLHTRDALMWRK